MATFLSDNFTDTDGVAITAHTPDSGGSWSLFLGTAGTIKSNCAVGGGAYGYYFHSVAASTDGESVEANLTLVPDGTATHLLLRCNTTGGGNFYMLYWTGAVLDVWRMKNGSLANLGSLTNFSPTGNHVMKFTASGTGAAVTLEGFFEGVSKGTYVDSSADRITTLGAAGFVVYSTSTAGYWIDSIVANDAINGAAASSLILPRAGRRQQHLLVR